MGIVQFPLLAFQFRVYVFFQLIGQVCQHILFQASEYKRSYHFLQFPHGIFILALYDRKLYFFPEALIGIQKSRHQIIKNAPQLAQTILNRRSGKRQFKCGLYLLYRSRRLRIVIFDILCLVDDLTIESESRIIIDIPPQQIIRSQKNIPFS